MSFFLKNSQSYVQTVRTGLDAVEAVLNKSCSVNFTQCSTLMNELGAELIQSENCQKDYQLENPLVTQAYADFLNYGLVYDTTCLTLEEVGETVSRSTTAAPATKTTSKVSKTASTASSTATSTSNSTDSPHYCYTDALFDYNNSADAYLYLLPLGNTYPDLDSVIPSCSECTERIMAIFHEGTSQSNLTISRLYASAASVIEKNCGSSFINATSAESSQSDNTNSTSSAASAAHHIRPPSIPIFTIILPMLLLIISSF